MNIRPATLADIDHFLPMLEKLSLMHKALDPARYDFLPNLKSLYSPWLADLLADARHLILVAEVSVNPSEKQPSEKQPPEKPELIGLLISELESEIPIYHVTQYGYIHDLWIEENYRNRGIARQMIEYTIEHYRQQGVSQIRLSTVLGNESARRLYTTCGFRISTIDMLLEL